MAQNNECNFNIKTDDTRALHLTLDGDTVDDEENGIIREWEEDYHNPNDEEKGLGRVRNVISNTDEDLPTLEHVIDDNEPPTAYAREYNDLYRFPATVTL